MLCLEICVILNNAAPDESVTKALGLKTLSMHEHSGIRSSLGNMVHVSLR